MLHDVILGASGIQYHAFSSIMRVLFQMDWFWAATADKFVWVAVPGKVSSCPGNTPGSQVDP